MATAPQISEYRIKVLNRIKELEKAGRFDIDVEDDPPFEKLKKGDVDYPRRRLSSKLKAWFATKKSNQFFGKLLKKKQILINEVIGLENLKGLKGGAVLTQNHFHPFDGVPIHVTMNKRLKKKKLYTLIREGNYRFPGIFGFFMRNCYTIPLASDFELLKEMRQTIKEVLAKGNFLLVYAEQSMWWNYRKPKPIKPGAATFAVQNKVPLVPMYITMKDSNSFDQDGLPIQKYTLHILKPIKPDPLKNEKENILLMIENNQKAWKNCYEETYQIPLTYDTENK